MTTSRCNSVLGIRHIVGTFILALGMMCASGAQAQELSLTLFDGYTVTYLGVRDYVNPGDQQPGQAMQVIVPALSASPRDFVPVADNLFEEVLLPLLARTEITHAMIVQWRPEAEGAARLQFGEDVYYERQVDGAWARTSHLSQVPERSAYGRLDAAELNVIGGRDVMLLPPSIGYLYRYNRSAILVRSALAIDITDNEAVGGFVNDLLATEGRNGELGEALAAHPDAALVLYISNELPANRFQTTLTRSVLVPSEVVQRSIAQEGGNP